MSRRGPLVATVAGLAAALLVVFGLIVPKISQARASQTKLDQARQQQSVLELRLQELQATEARAQKLRAQLTKLQAAVPPTVDLPGLIRLLNDVATQSGVNFIAITPGQPTQSVASGLAQPAPAVSPTSLPTGGISSGSSVGISIVPVTITINGDFFAVDQYLFRLEVLPRISKVLSISLAPGPDRLPELSLSIQADFFTTDTSAGPGTVPGAQGAGSQPIPAPAPSTSATPTPTLTIPTASPSSTG